MKKYIILSLNDSTKDRPIFWRDNNAGYTYVPFAAGVYTEEQVNGNQKYYNDGINTIAIPLTDIAMKDCGLRFKVNMADLKKFVEDNKCKL